MQEQSVRKKLNFKQLCYSRLLQTNKLEHLGWGSLISVSYYNLFLFFFQGKNKGHATPA